MLLCQKSLAYFRKHSADFILERSHGSCSDLDSDLLIPPVLKQHKTDSVEHESVEHEQQHSAPGSGTCWEQAEPQPAEPSAPATEKQKSCCSEIPLQSKAQC